MKLVVGITGATGTPVAVRALEALAELGVETHLVISRWGRATLHQELGLSTAQVAELATRTYRAEDQGAAISSGSFRTDGMLVVPCSMKTLAGIRTGFGESLISRAADVTLKERRKLVLVTRETPLSSIHLENMLSLSRNGSVIFPLSPAFYNEPETIADIVDHLVARILDQFSLDLPTAKRWTGMRRSTANIR
ncbi:UbiX family flavin prenyltransferase [Saccharopolyspora sp. WRP15-2]|uniref:Flavin prenyltransferase UbiX n=1 Tax=Saccharopolyspora oryzae TaxID=2997343 RepID=A0ABT4USF4_9PSEU|nr:UbiX family flavin prenyltransferase [Saccharopolyspora oryzae]MDA3624652.1 UbiX family flavin prenyltransferase [Saccharopolyspora oryzae]